MQLTNVLFTLAAASVVVAAPTDPALDCNSPDHPCNTYHSYENCSEEYLADLKKCVAVGACGIRWFQDPVKACDKPAAPDCNSVDHPCNTYNKHSTCTSQYVNELQQCIDLGACGKRWIRNPLDQCKVKDNDCGNKYHDCKLYTKEEQCSDAWKEKLQHCLAVGACGIRWFRDPMDQCKDTQA